MSFSSGLKEFIISVIRSTGFNITKYPLRDLEAENLNRALAFFEIDVLFDIGANTGQFAKSIRKHGYNNQIVSFEPLMDAHKQLLINSANDKKWKVHERCAVGNKNGEIEINIAGNSQSSSILPMLSAHTDAAPDSHYFKSEQTKIIKLDSVFLDYKLNNQKIFLKIDTQGYEKEVLEGAQETLEKVKAIQIELSLVPLYVGQPFWEDILADLANKGFRVWSILPVLTDSKTGRHLQVDAVLFKE